MTTGHTNEVMLTDKLKLVLRYPILKDMKSISGSSEIIDKTFKIVFMKYMMVIKYIIRLM